MKFLNRIDPLVIFPIIGLSGISLAIISSTTPLLFSQQLFFFIFGGFLYFVFSNIDYRIWPRFRWIIYIISLILLLITFLGREVRGSSRWVDLGWFRLQPSEIIKPFVVIFLADIFSRSNIKSLFSLITPFAFFLPVILLIFKQPDLGNVLIFCFVFFLMIFITLIPWWKILISFGILLFIQPLIWLVLRDYQKARILSFINPLADPKGAGYNALQAIIAIGSGRWMGLGLGRGTQSHLLFLPEYHTDFVFASISEELGFLGSSFVIIFYLILLSRILLISSKENNRFAQFFSLGIFALAFGQVFINIGMNLGILPITGITLPLLSYGGSSIISTFIGLGIVQNIARSAKLQAPIEIK